MKIADLVTVLTAVTTLVTAVGVIIVGWRQASMKKTVVATQAVAEKTEQLVNSRMDGMMRLLETYRDALQVGGVKIPSDVSIPKRHGEIDA